MGFAHILTGRSYRLFGTLLATVAVPVFIIGTIFYFLPISLATSESSYFSQTRVWAHRGGNAGEFAENSPEAVADAFAKGFDGVELDIYFDRSLDKMTLETALAALEERERTVISLRYYRGLPQARTAELQRAPLQAAGG